MDKQKAKPVIPSDCSEVSIAKSIYDAQRLHELQQPFWANMNAKTAYYYFRVFLEIIPLTNSRKGIK
mgnify:CR=1 FL=1